MSPGIRIKFCGLTESADVSAALLSGAAYVGFVFHERSPRHLDLAAAAFMARNVRPGLCRVALTVNADDDTLDRLCAAVPVDMLQLHGSETPERVAAIKGRYGLPVMKSIAIGDEADLRSIDAYAEVADQILVDARPPKDAVLPGGNGLAFDWRLISGRRWTVPWMLAGGLTPANVAEAVRLTGARQVDVSSGIESAPGVKDGARMRAFSAALDGL